MWGLRTLVTLLLLSIIVLLVVCLTPVPLLLLIDEAGETRVGPDIVRQGWLMLESLARDGA